jgi:hypothetical protein
MAKCIDCGSYTKFYGGLCFSCYKKEGKSPSPISYKPETINTKSTGEARALFDALIQRGVPAELEKWDGYKHIDIAVTEAKVNIEVDGLQHNYSDAQALSDLMRTCYSYKKGYLTLRVPNSLIRNKLHETADLIVDYLNKSREELEKSWF